VPNCGQSSSGRRRRPAAGSKFSLDSSAIGRSGLFLFLVSFAPMATKERPILIINALGDGAMRGGAR